MALSKRSKVALNRRSVSACLPPRRPEFAAHYNKAPDQISEQEFREYLLYLKNELHYSPSYFKVIASGIVFFYTHTSPRDWPTFKTLSIPRPKSLPDVLSIDEKCAGSSTPFAPRTTRPSSGPSTRSDYASRRP